MGRVTHRRDGPAFALRDGSLTGVRAPAFELQEVSLTDVRGPGSAFVLREGSLTSVRALHLLGGGGGVLPGGPWEGPHYTQRVPPLTNNSLIN